MAVSAKLIQGGENWKRALAPYANADGGTVRIGVLEGSTYSGETAEDGTPVAAIAAIHEFGASYTMPPREQTLNFKMSKSGVVGNKFVKKSKSNFQQTVNVGSYQVNIPPRSFMRSTLAAKEKEWMRAAIAFLKANPGNLRGAFSLVGQIAEKDIQEKITWGIDPPLSKARIRQKSARGRQEPDTPLIDTGTLQESISHELVGF